MGLRKLTLALLVVMVCSSGQLWGQQVHLLHNYEEKTIAGPTDYIPRLFDISPYDQHYEDVTRKGHAEPLAFMTFAPKERFVFVVPVTLLGSRPHTWIDHGTQWWGMGVTYFWWDHDLNGDTPARPVAIPDKILRIRQTLLDAEAYFDNAFKQAGITPKFYEPDEPIKVFVGVFGAKSVALGAMASTNAWNNRIKIRFDLIPEELETTAVHEYFHIVQKAVAKDPVSLSTLRDADNSEFRLWKRFSDWTCQWASDEPIQVNNFIEPGLVNVDDINEYIRHGTYFGHHQVPLFNRNQYLNGLVIKYLAEQAVGGSDTSAAAQVLSLHRRFAEPRPAADILQAMTETLPEKRFAGKTWQDRWQRFYRAFAATNVVQRGSQVHLPSGLLGYHDDGFASLQTMYNVSLDATLYEDYSTVPSRVYPEPAANDQERKDRLAQLCGPPVRVEPLANRLVLINLSDHSDPAPPAPGRISLSWVHKDVKARTAFFYAEGDPGTDVFVLHQGTQAKTHRDRQRSAFVLNQEFTLTGDKPSDGNRPWVVAASPNITTVGRREYLWVGLINSAVDMQERSLSWSYVVTPGLIPRVQRSGEMGTPTVRLDRGTAYHRDEKEGFYNGDKFTIVVNSTGRAHVGDDSQDDIAPEKRTIDLQIISQETGQPINLVDTDGRAMKVSSLKHIRDKSYRYEFSGQIDPKNTVFGKCMFRVRLTTLLNLGEQDEFVDESYEFVLRDPRPSVERVQVLSGRELLYDSDGNIRAPAVPIGDKYELAVKVWFSQKMVNTSTSISIGTAPPYDQHKVTGLVWDGSKRMCFGFLTIDAADIPSLGGIMRFSITGISEAGVRVDTDAVEPGDQPDTRHFLLFNLNDFYELTFSVEAHMYDEMEFDDGGMGKKHYSTYTTDYGPLSIKLRLVPEGPRGGTRQEAYDIHKEAVELLDEVEDIISWYEEAVRGDQDKLEIAKEAADSDDGARKQMTKLGQTRGQRRAALAMWKNLVPDVESLVRVASGYRTYVYRPDLSGPIAARFKGARMTGQHNRPIWSPPTYVQSRREGRAKALQTDDVDKIGWGGWGGVTQRAQLISLRVWRFNRQDMVRLAERIHKWDQPALPLDGPGSEAGTRERLDHQLNIVRDYAWSFYLEEDRPKTRGTRIPDRHRGWRPYKADRIDRSFPSVVLDGLWTLAMPEALFQNVHIASTETRHNTIWSRESPEQPPRHEVEKENVTSFRHNNMGPDLDLPWKVNVGGWFDREAIGRSMFLDQASGITQLVRARSMPKTRDSIRLYMPGFLNPQLFAQSASDKWFGAIKGRWQHGTWGVPDTGFTHFRYRFRVERVGGQGAIAGSEAGPSTASSGTGGTSDSGAAPAAPSSEAVSTLFEGGGALEDLRTTSTLVGHIANTATTKDPGHIVAYLEGHGLPEGKPGVVSVETRASHHESPSQGFKPDFLVLSVGSSIKFLNTSKTKSSKPYDPSSQGRFDMAVSPGETESVSFCKAGKIRVRDHANLKSRLKVLVTPNDYFADASNNMFQIRNVPPGTYSLKVVVENPRLYVPERQVVVRPGRPIEVHLSLQRRR